MGSKRSHDEEESILAQHGKKKVKKSSSSDSESSSSSIDAKLKKKLLKKLKKIKKKEKSKKKKKEKKSKKSKEKKKIVEKKAKPAEADIPSKSLTPMTKEEWEKQQNTLRRVYDEETGRTRLVKGTGEIVEECVSRERQLLINKQATRKDGEYFQKILSTKLK